MRLVIKFFTLFLFLLPICALGQENVQEYIKSLSLNQKEKGLLDAGDLIVRTTKIKDEVWPKVEVIAHIKANTLASVAIFNALDYQSKYVPNMLKSKPVKHVSPTEVHTDYVLKLPWPFDNSFYRNGTTLKKNGKDQYFVTWYQVKSDSADATNGSALFLPFKSGTLIHYSSMVKPKGFFAGIVRKFMVRDVTKSVGAIREHIEWADKHNPKLMQKYKSKIEKAFLGEYVYKNEIEGKK